MPLVIKIFVEWNRVAEQHIQFNKFMFETLQFVFHFEVPGEASSICCGSSELSEHEQQHCAVFYCNFQQYIVFTSKLWAPNIDKFPAFNWWLIASTNFIFSLRSSTSNARQLIIIMPPRKELIVNNCERRREPKHFCPKEFGNYGN